MSGREAPEDVLFELLRVVCTGKGQREPCVGALVKLGFKREEADALYELAQGRRTSASVSSLAGRERLVKALGLHVCGEVIVSRVGPAELDNLVPLALEAYRGALAASGLAPPGEGEGGRRQDAVLPGEAGLLDHSLSSRSLECDGGKVVLASPQLAFTLIAVAAAAQAAAKVDFKGTVTLASPHLPPAHFLYDDRLQAAPPSRAAAYAAAAGAFMAAEATVAGAAAARGPALADKVLAPLSGERERGLGFRAQRVLEAWREAYRRGTPAERFNASVKALAESLRLAEYAVGRAVHLAQLGAVLAVTAEPPKAFPAVKVTASSVTAVAASAREKKVSVESLLHAPRII